MSYINNVSCDKCGKNVNERDMVMVKHKEETFFLCLSCQDIDEDDLEEMWLERLIKQERAYENAWAKNVKKNGLEI